ncbi:hypothetical protein ACFO4E_13145 [Nocardiopsis mangrovi]|uniref:ABC transporter substrate-binding protein n=1 Tax=Nocardiopsis mangrovi TaxID=1179818 RepID=A0ABV9DXG6_9ACTN
MTDSTVTDAPGRRPAPPWSSAPDFLRLFTELRVRPTRAQIREERKAQSLAGRRRRHWSPAGRERGDTTDPPPVLDLALVDPDDDLVVVDLLKSACGEHPRWVLGAGSAKRAAAQPRRASDRVPTATTRDVVRRLSEMADSFTDGSAAALRWWERDPRPKRLRRLWSLVRLIDGVDVEEIRRRMVQEEAIDRTDAGRLLPEDRRTEIFLMEALGLARTDAPDGPDDDPSGGASGADSPLKRRILEFRTRILRNWTRFVQFIAGLKLFSFLDEKFLTPVSFIVAALLTVGLPSFAVSAITAANDLATQAVVAVLAVGNISLLAALVVPWWPYTWLSDYRQMAKGAGDETIALSHRTVGIRVVNGYAAGRSAPAASAEDAPAVQRIAVNALLDDLDAAYGSTRWGHRWLPRRRRTRRPVLIAAGRRIDTVDRHIIRLIEAERMRRRLPDPLLIVRVGAGERGTRDLAPWNDVAERAAREAVADPRPAVSQLVRAWRRERVATGVLGVKRVLTCDVPRHDPKWGRMRPPGRPIRQVVWETPALAAGWLAGGSAAGTALTVLTALLGPPIAHSFDACVQPGELSVPDGIYTADGACYGWTDGSYPFNGRLAAVQRAIADENARVEKESERYVTVMFVGSLSAGRNEEDRLAGMHGELAGLAMRQRQYNEAHGYGEGAPPVRLLLANAGSRWAQGGALGKKVAADLVASEDQPVAAVGFGHSVRGNTTVIGAFTRAGIPMVAGTATYDDIALLADETGERRFSQFFFPIAPSNTRIAQQAAYWAYHGAERTDPDSDPAAPDVWRLEPARRVVAIADTAEGDSYGRNLAEAFAAGFADLAGPAADGESAAEVHTYRGGRPTELSAALDEVCADPPDLIYYAGRSDDFDVFQDQLDRTRDCSAGVAVLGGDDVSKYVADNAAALRRQVFYTPLAASGAWELNGDLPERGFYGELEEFERDVLNLGESAGEDDRPSAAHAAIAGDTFTVVTEAILAVQRDRFGGNADWGDGSVPALTMAIRDMEGEVGVSGLLRFGGAGGDGSGHWFDDKLIQLAVAGPPDGQEGRVRDVAPGHEVVVVATCGSITPEQEGSGPNCRP